MSFSLMHTRVYRFVQSVICTDSIQHSIQAKIKKKVLLRWSLGTDLYRGDLDDYTP